MKLILIALLSLLSLSITNQAIAGDKPLSGQAKIDSLLAELPNAKGDTNEVELLSVLSSSLYSSNPDKGIEYGLKGAKLAKIIGWERGEAICYNSIGVNFSYGKGNDPEALEYYFNALSINEKIGNRLGIASNFGNITSIYLQQYNYPKAIEYCHKSLKLYEELDNKKGISNNLTYLGIIYKKQYNYSEALKYFKKSLKLSEELEDRKGIATDLMNIGVVYKYQQDFTKALDYFKRSLEINLKTGDKLHSAYIANNIGRLYLELTQDTTFTKINKESKHVSLDKEVNLNRAIEYFKEAEEIFEELEALNKLSDTYFNLYKSYGYKGEFKKSLTFHVKYKALQDSIFSQENADKIANLEKARENDLKQKEIEKQKIKIAAQEKREQLIMYFSIGIVLLMAVVMFVIFTLLKRSDKLLYNVLPVSIAKRLKKKEHPISDYFTQASIVFIDIVNFTEHSKDSDPRRVVEALNKIFTKYDAIANKYGLEKIKTIGDSYMAAAGIPEVQKDNTHRAAQMALEVKEMMCDYHTADGTRIEVRIGLDCGPVVAGVIGENKFIYDMWSDAVNTASRMESSSMAGEVHVSERFKETVTEYEEFDYVERGEIEIKGKGKMKTYFIGKSKTEM